MGANNGWVKKIQKACWNAGKHAKNTWKRNTKNLIKKQDQYDQYDQKESNDQDNED